MFIKAPCGRQRHHVLSALNALTLELVTVTNDTYINATSVCEWLGKIAGLGLKVPITLVLDNAKYQRCEAVFACAKAGGIERLFLPTYSPNLNLIERLWKFVKKKCLNAKYYGKFPAFRSAITHCLEKLDTDYKEELAQLMTLKFQTFKNVQILAR